MKIQNSRRINWSDAMLGAEGIFQTSKEAREAGNAYLAALAPEHQIARSIKVVRDTFPSSNYIYEIYLGDRPRVGKM